MRELQARLKCINIRKHNTLSEQAALHGIKVPYKYNEVNETVEFTKEQDEFLSLKLKEAQARKIAEMRANG